MAQKKSPLNPAGPSKGRHPTATIDLKATEVKDGQSDKDAIKAKLDSSGPTASAQNKNSPGDKPDTKKSAGTPPPKKPPTSSSKRADEKSSGGFISYVTSGAVGGALALLAAILIQNAPPGSNGAATPSPQLVNRINAIEQRMASLPETSPDNTASPDMTELKAQVEKLEITNAELRARTNATDKALSAIDGQQIPDEIKDRLRRLQETIAALAGSTENPGSSNVAEIASLVGRINDFEAVLDAKIAGLREKLSAEIKSGAGNNSAANADIETLKTDFQNLSGEINGLNSRLRLDLQKSDKKITGVLAENSRLQQNLKSSTRMVQTLASRFDALKSDIDARSKSLAKTDVVKAEMDAFSTRLTALDNKLNELDRREIEQRKNATNVLLSLALGNLKRAVDKGASYSRELDEIRKLAGGSLDLSALENYKNSDVLTLTALQKSFRTLARNTLSTAMNEPGGSVFGRLLSSAKGIIRIRKTGDVAGDDTEAILARMETRLKNGDLDNVLSEAKKLPDAAGEATSEWLEQVEARNSINRSLVLLEERFKSSLQPISGGTTQ